MGVIWLVACAAFYRGNRDEKGGQCDDSHLDLDTYPGVLFNTILGSQWFRLFRFTCRNYYNHACNGNTVSSAGKAANNIQFFKRSRSLATTGPTGYCPLPAQHGDSLTGSSQSSKPLSPMTV